MVSANFSIGFSSVGTIWSYLTYVSKPSVPLAPDKY
jgi:hypothetical protein